MGPRPSISSPPTPTPTVRPTVTPEPTPTGSTFQPSTVEPTITPRPSISSPPTPTPSVVQNPASCNPTRFWPGMNAADGEEENPNDQAMYGDAVNASAAVTATTN